MKLHFTKLYDDDVPILRIIYFQFYNLEKIFWNIMCVCVCVLSVFWCRVSKTPRDSCRACTCVRNFSMHFMQSLTTKCIGCRMLADPRTHGSDATPSPTTRVSRTAAGTGGLVLVWSWGGCPSVKPGFAGCRTRWPGRRVSLKASGPLRLN
jgi:hypothetical protein